MDVLSDVLRLVRLKSCVYFARDFCAPWGMQLGGGDVAQFHAVLRGQCVVKSMGETYYGAPGDVFLFPKCAPHIISDNDHGAAVAGSEFMASLEKGTPLFANGNIATQLICGHYEYRNDIEHPLIQELPDVIHVRFLEQFAPGTFQSVLPILAQELTTEAPGAEIVIEKFAEILLVQVIRAHFKQEKTDTGLLAGIFDNKLGKAFALIHGNLDQPLTLEDLAAAAGMSRSAFALHFKTVVGMSPISYLASWRLSVAHDLLQTRHLSVSEAAYSVGYDSDVAFSRAFKRQFEKTPASVRN
ncbi:MAG: AraC family transcriptional regulator [Sneathiella sp.]